MCERERESKRGSEKERRKRGIWEGEESRLRVVKNEPTGETFFFTSRKNRREETEGMFYAFQLPTSPAYSGWKVEVNIHCTKIVKGKRGGGKSCETLSQSRGKRCPCPSSGSRVVLSLQYHLSPVTPQKP